MPDGLPITPHETLEVLERTSGVLVLDASYAPGGSAPPAHHHPEQDERFEILEGVLRVEVAGVQRDLPAGETLDVPRGTAHRMWNPHARPARTRWETRPTGRTEDWLTALAALQGTEHVDASGRPRPLPFAALAHEYRDTFRLAVGPAPVTRAAVRALAGVARATGRAPASATSSRGGDRSSARVATGGDDRRGACDRSSARAATGGDGWQAGDPWALSGPLAGISFVTGVAAGLGLADAPYPRPGSSPRAIRRYFTGSAGAARLGIGGQLVSAASLARFTASAARLAEASGPRSPSLRRATTVAGRIATGSLAASALNSLALTGPAAKGDATATALHRRAFVAGGPVHTAAFGALVGCLSLAGRRSGRLPRTLTAAGLASATAGALSPLYFVAEPAGWLIPIGRFTGLIVVGVAGVRLSRPAPDAGDA